MRIVFLSDTHRDFFSALEIVKRHLHDADIFVHLGDGLQEWDDVRALYPEKRMLAVRGNCDFARSESDSLILPCEFSHRILCVHGHLHNVKYTPDQVMATARANQCDIVVHGHTHTASRYYEDGLYLFCPGSPSRPKDSPPGYGIIDLTEAGVFLNNVRCGQDAHR